MSRTGPFEEQPCYSLLIDLLVFWGQVEVSSKYSTVDTLKQEWYFVPAEYKVNSCT
jgi:hypothetical protein